MSFESLSSTAQVTARRRCDLEQYPSLNPIRAGMAETLEQSDTTSVQRRVQAIKATALDKIRLGICRHGKLTAKLVVCDCFDGGADRLLTDLNCI